MKKSARLSLRISPELKDTIEKFLVDYKIKNYGTFLELATQIITQNTKEFETLILTEKKELKSVQQRIKYLSNKYKSKGEEDEKDNLRQI